MLVFNNVHVCRPRNGLIIFIGQQSILTCQQSSLKRVTPTPTSMAVALMGGSYSCGRRQ
jgi:hypothetical protein